MTQILISVSHIYISDRYIIFMILVLENMDIQDIVLFNYGDTINGTSLHSTRIPFTLDFSRSGFITILSLFFEPVQGTLFLLTFWNIRFSHLDCNSDPYL